MEAAPLSRKAKGSSGFFNSWDRKSTQLLKNAGGVLKPEFQQLGW